MAPPFVYVRYSVFLSSFYCCVKLVGGIWQNSYIYGCIGVCVFLCCFFLHWSKCLTCECSSALCVIQTLVKWTPHSTPRETWCEKKICKWSERRKIWPSCLSHHLLEKKTMTEGWVDALESEWRDLRARGSVRKNGRVSEETWELEEVWERIGEWVKRHES